MKDKPQQPPPQADPQEDPQKKTRQGNLWEWTRFGEKGLWDWLQLLIIPVMLTVGGLLFNAAQNSRQQEAEERRAQSQQEVEEQRAQEEALQAYLTQMGDLLVNEGLRDSQEDNELRTLARARTTLVLERLDPDRKVRIIRFLYESALLDKDDPVITLYNANLEELSLGGKRAVLLPDVDLSGASLARANLSLAQLQGAKLSDNTPQRSTDLSEADLRGANLTNATLPQAMLQRADLSKYPTPNGSGNPTRLQNADLTGAVLQGANLSGAELTGADLGRAHMRDSDLSEANLSEADLGYADLTGATVTDEQLAESRSLEGATMPDGSAYDYSELPVRGELEYAMVADDTGALSVEVPSNWSATITDKQGTFEGEDVDPGEGIGPALTATTDLDAWASGQGVPGLYILASRELASYAEDKLVDSLIADLSACKHSTRENFDRSPYSGKVQWTDCRDGAGRLTLVANHENRECAVRMQILTYNEVDREAARHILDTFESDCNAID